MRPRDVRSRQSTPVTTTVFAAVVTPLAVEVHRAGGPLRIDRVATTRSITIRYLPGSVDLSKISAIGSRL